MAKLPEIFICSEDAAALGRLLDEHSHPLRPGEDARIELSQKLFDAIIVSRLALPFGTVRLGSRVTYEELPSGPRRVVTIVGPRAVDASAGLISVFSPVGRALLGHVVGGTVEVPLFAGRTLNVRIAAVEAAEAGADRVLAPA